VNYWEARRELFGPDKYLLRMSLSEAVRDDMAALESGVYRLLPGPDLSGRPLVYMDSSRNTGASYTPESLVSGTRTCSTTSHIVCISFG